jgi:hypothetical protein
MKIENSFTVNQPPDEAWRTLLDIPAIVPCMPGASLLEVEDERSFKGQVKLKLGPVAIVFQGRAKFIEVDEAHHRVRAKASGNEMKGRGNAQADVEFKLSPSDEGTRVDVVTDVNLAGSVAQYGRAQGVIAGVAQVLIDQFAANLRQQLAARAQTVVPDHPKAAEAPTRAAETGPALKQLQSPPSVAEVKGVSVFLLLLAYIHSLFSGHKRKAS